MCGSEVGVRGSGGRGLDVADPATALLAEADAREVLGLRAELVVGHEPTVSHVALGLAGPGATDRDAVDRISMKFPTSGIAVLRVPGGWARLELNSAELVSFHVPR